MAVLDDWNLCDQGGPGQIHVEIVKAEHFQEDSDSDLEESVERPAESAEFVSYYVGSKEFLQQRLRSGWIWHAPGIGLEKVFLTIHAQGLSMRYQGLAKDSVCVPLSPFAHVQSCRMNSAKADRENPHVRVFKVSIFHLNFTTHFAVCGPNAETERAKWVTDIALAIRNLTRSLIPAHELKTLPLRGVPWTASRLLAGYMLLYDDTGVTPVYCDLHAKSSNKAEFSVYQDASCSVALAQLEIDINTSVTERNGVDCSCFLLGKDLQLCTRSTAEKVLWLRAISNVKLKLRHGALHPGKVDLRQFRKSIRQLSAKMAACSQDPPLLPRRMPGQSLDQGYSWRQTSKPKEQLPLLPSGFRKASLQKLQPRAGEEVDQLPTEEDSEPVTDMAEPPVTDTAASVTDMAVLDLPDVLYSEAEKCPAAECLH